MLIHRQRTIYIDKEKNKYLSMQMSWDEDDYINYKAILTISDATKDMETSLELNRIELMEIQSNLSRFMEND